MKTSLRFKWLCVRFVACMLAVSLLSVDVFAVVKSVKVFGVKSINDLGVSDNRISMDDLDRDYSGYLRSDSLTEYFHKDVGEIPKTDMTEAMSWLIDHNIISRDQTITVSRVSGVPDVDIKKVDMSGVRYTSVNRSDAVMYLYKAIFGPLRGRTIGVETASIRSENGKAIGLYELMEKNGYLEEMEKTKHEGIIQENNPSGASHGIEIITPNGHYDEGGVGANGTVINKIVDYIDTSTWRYTPQGDVIKSVFGDTNLFISDVQIVQGINTGNTGDISGMASPTLIESGSHGGGAASTGNGQAAIDYDTDYKEIFYVPGADVLFYGTNDVLEMYLQSLKSKGILPSRLSPDTQKATDLFLPLTASGAALASWSGNADPYIVNMSVNQKVRVEKVNYATLREMLGANYTVNFGNNTLNITRVNPFDSNSGYFSKEDVTKMDIYEYAYRMLFANEKKLTNLEVDIVNYKYGLQLSGLSSTEDIEIVKYLIAKGILDYDGGNDIDGLYGAMTYDDFFTLLYRLANPNARLDFSKIQLTDSESNWKAKGFQPLTVNLVENQSPRVYVTSSGDYTSDLDDEEIPLSDSVSVPLSDLPVVVGVNAAPEDDFGVDTVASGAAQTISYNTRLSNTVWNSWYLDMHSRWADNSEALAELDDLLAAIDTTPRQYMQDRHDKNFQSSNPVHMIYKEFASNLWYCLYISEGGNGGEVSSRIKAKMDAMMALRDSAIVGTQEYTVYDEWYSQLAGVLNTFEDNCERASVDFPDDTVFRNTNLTNANGAVNTGGKPLQSFLLDGWNRIVLKQGLFIDLSDNFLYTNRQGTDPSSCEVTFSQMLSSDEVTLAEGGIDGATRRFANAFKAIATGSVAAKGLETYTNGKDQYIPYTQLVQNSSISQWNGNEWILYNKDNGVRAIFTNADAYKSGTTNVDFMSTALIGSAVVRSSSPTGVAYRDTTGEPVMMYHLDAVRALLGANSEVEVIGTNFVMGVNDADFTNAVKSCPVVSSSGLANGAVSAVSVLLSSYSGVAPYGIDANSPYYQGSRYTSGGVSTVWGTFLAVSEASNLVNYATRRVVYSPGTEGSKDAVGYMVLSFEVDDTLKDSAKSVNGGTMLQDILDTPNKKPDDTTAAKTWEKNRDTANLFANVVYGTTGATYVQTGWLKPRLDFYVCGEASELSVPDSVFAPISDARALEYADIIQIHSMVKYTSGAVMPVGASAGQVSSALVGTYATYWVSSDAKIMVSGERIYLNSKAIPGLTPGRTSSGDYCFVSASNTATTASFTVGTSFTVFGDTTNPPIQGKVMETTDKGRIRCQIGPIVGYPISFDGRPYVVDSSDTSSLRLSIDDTSLYYLGRGDGTHDLVYGTFLSAFRSTVFDSVEFKGISSDPLPVKPAGDNSSLDYFVFNGTSMHVYGGNGVARSSSISPVVVSVGDSCSVVGRMYSEKAASSRRRNLPSAARCYTYFDVEFDGTQYKIVNGVLMKGTASAQDYLSPELFTSLNNTIIDGMIGEATGAIPINEVPEGALLKIGDGYFASRGSSASTKEFVGFAAISGNVQTATLQNSSMFFANHNIRAGSQLVNISHFFKTYKILDLVTGTDKNDYSSDIELAKSEIMALSPNVKLVAVNINGSPTTLANDAQSVVSTYAAVSIQFQDYLMAFEEQSDSGGVKRYTVLSTAVSNTGESALVDGALADVPFFENSVITRGVAERTSDAIASTYQSNWLASQLREAIRRDYQRVLNGDLITLARFILFIVLMWLILAAWLCYGARVSNLIPILDAIKHPSGDRNQNGVDLMKIVSLGTISLETEFGLGKFLQYNAVLCLLLCVVMLSGRITFGG